MPAYEAKMSLITNAENAERNFEGCDHLLFRSGGISCCGKTSLKNSVSELSQLFCQGHSASLSKKTIFDKSCSNYLNVRNIVKEKMLVLGKMKNHAIAQRATGNKAH